MRWPEGIVKPMRHPMPGLLARLHVIDGETVFPDPLLVVIEVRVLQALERRDVDARRVGAAQDDRVMVEFVGRLEIDAPVRAFRHLMQADALGVKLDRRGHVQNANLDEAGTYDSCHCHVVILLRRVAGPALPLL